MTIKRSMTTLMAGIWLVAAFLLWPAANVTAAALAEDEKQVIAANEAFYSAFRSNDMAAMEAVWSQTEQIAVIHPGWPELNGRAQVLESWRKILTGTGAPPNIHSVNARAYVYPGSAFVICYENLGGAYMIATNIFARENGEWRMVHHQAGPTPTPTHLGQPI